MVEERGGVRNETNAESGVSEDGKELGGTQRLGSKPSLCKRCVHIYKKGEKYPMIQSKECIKGIR